MLVQTKSNKDMNKNRLCQSTNIQFFRWFGCKWWYLYDDIQHAQGHNNGRKPRRWERDDYKDRRDLERAIEEAADADRDDGVDVVHLLAEAVEERPLEGDVEEGGGAAEDVDEEDVVEEARCEDSSVVEEEGWESDEDAWWRSGDEWMEERDAQR